MTHRSRRRDAELAVLNSADALVNGHGLWSDLEAAVRHLDQIPLDPTPPAPDNGTDTSAEAAHSVQGALGPLETKIWYEIHVAGGLTTDQVEQILVGRHQTISARVNSMKNRGWIRDSGRRRKTRTGRQAAVYVVTRAARIQMGA